MEVELKDIKMKNRFLEEVSQRLDISRFEISEPSLQSIFISRVQEEQQ